MDKSVLGWHCCGVMSCVVHQSKYLNLCLVAWYPHVSCMTLFVICCSVLSLQLGFLCSQFLRLCLNLTNFLIG